jgi:hypothetical protein
MNVKATLPVILAFVAIGFIADSAMAKRIPAKSQEEVKKSCQDSGGVNFPKTGKHGTYGCINDDGSGIVCGGVTNKDKKTCSTFVVVPPRLPTRDEVEYAEKAEKAEKPDKTNGVQLK